MTQDDKVKESVEVRGIAAAIQAMAFPTFENLKDILKKLGWTLTKSTEN